MDNSTRFLDFNNTTAFENASTRVRKRLVEVPTMSIIQFTIGVLGNILALIVLFRTRKRHKWGVFYIFVLALAITDLTGLLTTSPVAFAYYDEKVDLRKNVAVCHYMAFWMIFVGLATVLILGVMALDRFMAIVHPFKYSILKRKSIVAGVLIGIWTFTAIYSLLPHGGLGKNVVHIPFSWCFFDYFGNETTDHIYGIIYAVLGIATIAMTGVLNIRVIYCIISSRNNSARRGSISSRQKTKRSRRDLNISIFLMVELLVFAVCWAPFMFRLILNQSQSTEKDWMADILTLIFASWNQVLDPWVYLLFRHEMLVRLIHFIGLNTNLLRGFVSTFRSRKSSQKTAAEIVSISSNQPEDMVPTSKDTNENKRTLEMKQESLM